MSYTSKQIKEYEKHGLNRETVEKVHSRAMDSKGRVYQGEAGRQLRNRQLAQQAYYKRNQKSVIGLR